MPAVAAQYLQPATVARFDSVVAAAGTAPVANQQLAAAENLETAENLENWTRLYDETKRLQPWLAARPDVELLALRRLERVAGADSQARLWQHWETLATTSQLVGWPQMAQQELALLRQPLKEFRWYAQAHFASTRPILDGVLDESLWTSAIPLRLTSTDNTSDTISAEGGSPEPTTLWRWAYDDRYLYLAVECPYARGQVSPPTVNSRRHDDDLSSVDHVEVILDIDRDYATAIELAVSADGRTFDRCCGFSEYNPKWHVCVRAEADRWLAEVAIELVALSAQRSVAGNTWAWSARRFNPHGAPQSWSQLRTHMPYLHASGLLVFDALSAQELVTPEGQP